MANVVGCASIARALSGHIDKPFGFPMRTFFQEIFPINVGFLAPYPDLFSFSSILLLTCKYIYIYCFPFIYIYEKQSTITLMRRLFIVLVLIAWGMRESSLLNKVFTIVNLLTVTIVVITGLFKSMF